MNALGYYSKLAGAIVGIIVIIVIGTFISWTKVKTQVMAEEVIVTPTTTVQASVEVKHDSDSDTLLDTDETTLYHTDPQKADTDGDGLSDYEELKIYHSDPLQADTDSDTYPDGHEVANGFSPIAQGNVLLEDVDTDGDGLSDAMELKLGTRIDHPDSDNDAVSDKEEVYAGANPLVSGEDRAGVVRHVEVDLTHQRMQYFFNHVSLGTMLISSGLPRKPTPTGEFEILRKLPVARYVGREPGDEYDLPNVKWNLEFKHTYFFHTAYWHNQFGIRAMSHGCVNMRLADAKKLYKFLDVGDKVLIEGKTPIGKVKKDEVVNS